MAVADVTAADHYVYHHAADVDAAAVDLYVVADAADAADVVVVEVSAAEQEA